MSRKSLLEESFEDLLTIFFEVTGMSWIAGVIISTLLTLAGFMSLSWAIKITTESNVGWLTQAINNTWLGYAPYAFPAIFFILALIFVWRSLDTYLTQNS